MILENMAVTGFRGISQLSLPLEGTNVLIGENAWGKSSLLDALTLLLAPQPDLYAFRPHDFHFAQGDAARRERDLQVVFTFCEREAGEADALHYQVFAPLWWCGEDGLRRLTLKMTGHQPDAGEVITHRQFVDACSQPLLTDERALAAIKTLIRLHPVLRLRDARFSRRQPHDAAATLPAAPFAELTSIMEDLLREGGRAHKICPTVLCAKGSTHSGNWWNTIFLFSHRRLHCRETGFLTCSVSQAAAGGIWVR